VPVKRAAVWERTKGSERARDLECTIISERAIVNERAVKDERAISNESAKELEPESAGRQPRGGRLAVVPLTFRQASAFVLNYHRHNKPPRGAKFCLGAIDEDCSVRGVAIVGRPIARAFDDGITAEVLRTCTDGCKNANSFLYAAAWRVAREMGYTRLLTYTQGDEPGTGLVAAGWKVVAERQPRKNWYGSTSPEMRAARTDCGSRDPLLAGGVQRTLWEVRAE
jgi:hypothetical protein